MLEKENDAAGGGVAPTKPATGGMRALSNKDKNVLNPFQRITRSKRRKLPASFQLAGEVAKKEESQKGEQKLERFSGRYVYARSKEEVEVACKGLLEASVTEFGFDMEWRVFFKKGANQGKVALIQLCCSVSSGQLAFIDGLPWSFIDEDGFKSTEPVANKRATKDGRGEAEYLCFLLHIHHSGITNGLKEILTKESIRKFGVNIGGDVKKLFRDYEIEMLGHESLGELAAQHPQQKARYGGKKNFSLKDLARIFLGRPIDKNNKVRVGNWERDELNYEKILYAATDSYASLRIFEEIDQGLEPGAGAAAAAGTLPQAQA
jgi:hypothetical protein